MVSCGSSEERSFDLLHVCRGQFWLLLTPLHENGAEVSSLCSWWLLCLHPNQVGKGACQKCARSEAKLWRACSSSPSWENLPSHCPTSFDSSKTQVSFIHFSDLTPGENLSFTRAFVPQAPLTLAVLLCLPSPCTSSALPGLSKADFFVLFILSVALCFPYRTLLSSDPICAVFGLQFFITLRGQVSSSQYQTPKISCAWFSGLPLLSWPACSGVLLQLDVIQNKILVWCLICVIPSSTSKAAASMGKAKYKAGPWHV